MSAADWWTAASKPTNRPTSREVDTPQRRRSGTSSGAHTRNPTTISDSILSSLFGNSRTTSNTSSTITKSDIVRRRDQEQVWRIERDELIDIVERATGMGRIGEVRRGGDTIVGLVSRKWVGASAVMNAIVVGENGGRRALMVLGLVHRVCMVGPWAMENGWEDGVRICGRIKEIVGRGNAGDVKECLKLYARFLEGKLMLHGEFEEFEGNWSLDRYYRRVDLENKWDKTRKRSNAERHGLVFSEEAYEKLEGLLKVGIRAAEALLKYDMQLETIERVCADVCNLYALTRYMDSKLFDGEESTDLANFKMRIRKVLLDAKARKGEVTPVLKRNVERTVIKMIMEEGSSRDQRPMRPESRFRKEIVCRFTSFETMHEALAPPS